ncbi:3-deoxy-manno-octulosonate cytidylyltransferase [Kiloniella laminariae]|uniref:3-deoxy-manno-octulosonate cytidylyltransferase n=1 Tax=Kiloniella laminariae TaxID=454162 RepID=UPI0004759068|nr:3-deoxy-manno-octulosonate cytidylyltransferase [Kiloniella laminariae]
MTQSICIIPARMASSRFPGKPMKHLLGMPLIQHVWERCQLAKEIDHVIVATCDQEIYDCIVNVGGSAIMTSNKHERCTDRVAEAIENGNFNLKEDDLVLMVQGDEVMVNPELLDDMIRLYKKTKAPAINLVSRLYNIKEHDDPNVVKIVTDLENRIIFLSRSPIPSRSRSSTVEMYQQTGIIAYSSSFLTKYAGIPQTPLEIAESIDMLRLIENGIPLFSIKSEVETIGVDTENDRKRAEVFLEKDDITSRYLNIK